MSESQAVEALNAIEKGEAERAHELVQSDGSAQGAWVHAHIHRMEGDEANARYWYDRAGRMPATGDLDSERAEIRAALLA